MKRELKLFNDGVQTRETAIAKPIPMKRELKHPSVTTSHACENSIAKPIPMKRELKHSPGFQWGYRPAFIAKPIPMKRELKLGKLPLAEQAQA